MKIDGAMLKQINQAVTTELKKNKDIKAAADVEKNIDKFISKNKEAIANARAIQQLEKRAKDLETKLRTMEKTVESISKQADQNSRKLEMLEKEVERLRK